MACILLTEVRFAPDSLIREFGGFRLNISLRRIEMPASVEVIWQGAFSGCTLFSQVTLAGVPNVKRIHGFQQRRSFDRIVILASAERID
jgi:hypothetical protein